MKALVSIFILAMLVSCADSKKSEENKEKKTKEEKIDNRPKQNGVQSDGAYREFYSNGKVKIEGFLNQKGEKGGLWRGYHQQGWLQSEILYIRGKKNGHAVVFFPNQQPKYIGEYKNDIKVGHWRFFDEEGNLTKEVHFKEEE